MEKSVLVWILAPLPFIPSHDGEGSFYWGFPRDVRDTLSDFIVQNLLLFFSISLFQYSIIPLFQIPPFRGI
jgi:hypothetical protein